MIVDINLKTLAWFSYIIVSYLIITVNNEVNNIQKKVLCELDVQWPQRIENVLTR